MKKFICIIALLLAPAIAYAGEDGMQSIRELHRMLDQDESNRKLDRHFRQMQEQQEVEQQQLDQIEQNQRRIEQELRDQEEEQEQQENRRRLED